MNGFFLKFKPNTYCFWKVWINDDMKKLTNLINNT